MRADAAVRVAVWLAERGRAGEGFAGDLLEGAAEGRSGLWCLREAVRRVLSLGTGRARAAAPSVLYCVVFVCLHPLWQGAYAARTGPLLGRLERGAAWPGSAVLALAEGFAPAMLFVWVGLVCFLLLRREAVRAAGAARVLLAFSLACSTVSAETLWRLRTTRVDLQDLSRGDFFYPTLHAHFSVMLFAGLLAAVMTVRPVRAEA